MDKYIFSSESVGEGHPDKVADTISDAVLDACLAQDKFSRVACETYVKSNTVVVGGEITTKAKLDFVKIARESIREIGYVNDDDVFHADKVFVNVMVTQQSPDIAQGVDARKAAGKKTAKQGAGDQGLMFGYASNETPELMPAPIMFAHRLGRELTRIRKSGGAQWLRPDAKSQVSVVYENDKPVGHCQRRDLDAAHAGRLAQRDRELLHRERDQEGVAREAAHDQDRVPDQSNRALRRRWSAGRHGTHRPQDHRRHLRRHGPSRRWRVLGQGSHEGGSQRRVHGPVGREEYRCREACPRCEVQFAYAIGHPDPVSVHIETFGTATVDIGKITRAVNRVFSFQPADIIDQLNLRRPIFLKTTNYGHFGKSDKDLTWEVDEQGAGTAEGDRQQPRRVSRLTNCEGV